MAAVLPVLLGGSDGGKDAEGRESAPGVAAMAPPPLALTLPPRTRWQFSSQYTSVPHCEHFILAPSASQLPQRPTALFLPSLVLPFVLVFPLPSPSPFLRGLPSAPPRSSGWGRWKTVGSYEGVQEEERELVGSCSGSSAAPFPSFFVLLCEESAMPLSTRVPF